MRTGLVDPAIINAAMTELRRDPARAPILLDYLRRNLSDGGTSLSRRDVIEYGPWYGSPDYQMIYLPCGLDHLLWGLRQIPGAYGDESSGLILTRAAGRPDFDARPRSLVRAKYRRRAPP